jgi:hypothetical protein
MFEYDKNLLNDRLVEEYKHIYEFEIQRKDRFGSKNSLAIAIVTLVIGAMTAMATRIPQDGSLCRSILCTVMVLTYLCLGVSISNLFRAIRPRKYSYLANITEIDKAIQLMHHRELSSEEMSSEFNNFLVNRYCEAASENRAINNRKLSQFVRATTRLYLSVILLFLSIGLFAICSFDANEPIAKAQLLNSSLKIDPNTPVSMIINSKGDNKMSNGDEKPKEAEPIEWPENEKINENEEVPSEKHLNSKSD